MRAPDLKSEDIQAWHVKKTTPDAAAALNQWIVSGPFHPFWKFWIVSVVSLKEIPGIEPSKKHYPEAEYEISILSLHPDHPVDVDAFERGECLHPIMPPDLVMQIDGIQETWAIAIVDSMLTVIMSGTASPDSDFRSYWKRFIVNKMIIIKTPGP